ncbi:MAG: phospholipid carrier-dependent glycosyltransferase [Spirochaetia bacterium]|nr:MAG: phospholipid carrier-dependent glycosyltransferase [Spirochaetia bacterium]
MFKNSKLIILIIILIIAAFFRLYNIADLPPGLYPDEAMNGNNALEAISKLPSLEGFKIFYPENNGREGLFMNIQAVFLKILMPFFGDSPEPWMLRLPSAIFGILTVLGVYFLSKELFNKNVALLSSFFLATSFWHINFSRIGFRAIMAPFFLVWAVYFLLVSFKKTSSLNSKFYILNSIIGGLFFGLGFYSYIAYRVMPLLIAVIFFYYFYQNREFAKKLWAAISIYVIAAFIAALPIGIYFLKNPADFFGRTIQISVGVSQSPIKDLAINAVKTLGMFNFIGDGNWRHNIANAPELFPVVGILFIIGIIITVKSLIQNSKIKNQNDNSKLENETNLNLGFWTLFSWFILAMLPVVISNEGIPHALRSILLIPPAVIFAGVGGVWLIEKIKNQKSKIKITIQNSKVLNFATYTLLFVIIVLFVFQAYYAYFIQWGKNSNVQGAFAADYVQIGKELNALPKELPKYVLVQAGGVNVRGIPMPAQTVMFITDTFTFEKQIAKNIFYVLPDKFNQIPKNAYTVVIK